ncbi:hypothetical protein [Ruminococcus flavefaciens]|uniref:hypothetical protein n=1 Tax=Ruminococcus flavefaciens TaxID=1265 RepID=UPI00048C5442|nr:hypothetical protein [Ruminococcus flavefaciens]
MTDKEKEKLLEAFEIPDPDRKKQFADEFRKRTPEKLRKPLLPLVIKTLASAAMLTLVIAAITRLPKQEPNMYQNTDEIAATTENRVIEVSAQTTADTSSAVTTTAADKGGKNTTATTKAVSTDQKDQAEKTTDTDKAPDEDDDNTAPRVTAKTNRPNNDTATPRTTKTTPVRTTDSRESQHSASTTKPSPQPVSTTTAAPITGEIIYGRDMTVDLDVTYDIRNEILTAADLVQSDGNGSSDELPSGNDKSGIPADEKIRQMFDDSYDVILAKVDKIVYTSIDEEAYTAENLTIREVFKGNLKTDDKITLFISGGYISAEDYIKIHKYIFLPDAENYSIFDDGGCDGKEYVGDTYLFFIKNGSSSFPHNSFELISRGDEAVFRQAGDIYVSMHDESLSLDISSLY